MKTGSIFHQIDKTQSLFGESMNQEKSCNIAPEDIPISKIQHKQLVYLRYKHVNDHQAFLKAIAALETLTDKNLFD